MLLTVLSEKGFSGVCLVCCGWELFYGASELLLKNQYIQLSLWFKVNWICFDVVGLDQVIVGVEQLFIAYSLLI